MTKTLSILALIFSALSCEKNRATSESDFINVLKNSPETIELSDNSLSMEVSLARDFMPICEENGEPLYCTLELNNSQHLDLQEKIELKKIYVIYGDEIWNKTISKLYFGSGDAVRGFADKGPKWGPNVLVDVVCEFQYKGIIRRIISKQQNILLVE